MEFAKRITSLQQNLTKPLPGRIAHEKMARFGRQFDFKHQKPPKLAAVMILLYPKQGETYFVLIQRTAHPLDPHQNQVSFPGGRKEANEDFQQAANRETFEEIGVSPLLIHTMGVISEVYVGASNFMIHPYIGYTSESPIFIPQETEVKEILEIPLTHLLDPSRRKTTALSVRGFELKDVPYFDLADKIVWGATAMILNEFQALLR